MTFVETTGPLWGLALLLVLASGCGDEQSQAPSQTSASTSPSDTIVTDTATAGPETPPPSPDTATPPMASASSRADATDPVPDSTGPLTDAQKDRIGPTLRRLLRGDSLALDRVEPVGTRDGEPVYSVTVECDDAAALRAVDVPLTSVQGPIITARWTLDQIRTAATVTAVRVIRTDAPVRPHSESRTSPQPNTSVGTPSPTSDST